MDAEEVLDNIETGATLVDEPTTIGSNEALHKGNMGTELNAAQIDGIDGSTLNRRGTSNLYRHFDRVHQGVRFWHPFIYGSGSTCYDFSTVGRTSNGSLDAGVTWTTSTNRGSYALNFDGTSNTGVPLSGSNPELYNGSPFTVYASVLTDVVGDGVYRRLFSNHEGGDGIFMGIMDTSGEWQFGVHAGSSYYDIQVAAPSTGVWYDIFLVYDGSGIEAFIDGSSVGTNSFTAQTDIGPQDFTIGDSPYYDEPWDGRISEVRMYNRALTASERDEIRNGNG